MADAEMKTVTTTYKKGGRSKKRKRTKSVPRRLPAWRGGYLAKAPVPAVKIVNMRYCEQVGLSPAAGVAAEYMFRLNSIHDPNYTGVGHQPMGHDEWTAFYQHYEVIQSVITVWYIPQTDAGVGCTLRMDGNPTAISNPDEIMEQNHCVKTFAGRGRGSPAKLTLYWTPRTLRGRSADEGNGSASVGANPADIALAIVGGFSAANSGTSPTIDCQVQVDYKVRFSNPTHIGLS